MRWGCFAATICVKPFVGPCQSYTQQILAGTYCLEETRDGDMSIWLSLLFSIYRVTKSKI